MLKSWKSFIKTGDPSYPGYEWKPYNGIQLHMEIENDATVSIGGTQLYFGSVQIENKNTYFFISDSCC